MEPLESRIHMAMRADTWHHAFGRVSSSLRPWSITAGMLSVDVRLYVGTRVKHQAQLACAHMGVHVGARMRALTKERRLKWAS
jgi:hypothetical protein